jgi:hypothetical protein
MMAVRNNGLYLVKSDNTIPRSAAGVDAEPLRALPTDLDPGHMRLHFWHGASGRRIALEVFSLVGCPAVTDCAYMLVRRERDGRRAVLRIARTASRSGTLNLASIRQRAAQLGANEVHVYAIAESDKARALVALDLQARLFGALQEEPALAEPSRVAAPAAR